MNFGFKSCKIDGGVILGNNGSINNYSYKDIDSLERFISCMDMIGKQSNDICERNCAAEAKKFAQNKDHIGLKRYIIENISTFVTGMFATTAGGFLQEFIKNLIK